nr:hypothetical protein [Dyella sp. ASV24]
MRATGILGLTLCPAVIVNAQLLTPPRPPSQVSPMTGSMPSRHRAIATPRITDYAPLVRMLDSSIPLAEREALFEQMRAKADAGDTASQYLVGSLYREGDRVADSPVPVDLNKAQLYLSNAATHGHLYAMAKMSELSLQTDHLQSAMDWAQIFAYYVQRGGAQSEAFTSYTRELLGRISAKHDYQKQNQLTLSDLNAFIGEHSADIRAGLAVNRQIAVLPHNPFLEVNHHYAKPVSGFADFIIAFKSDGTVESVWLLDGTPTLSLANTLKASVEKLAVAPDPDRPRRYAWLAYSYDDVECPQCVLEYKRTNH